MSVSSVSASSTPSISKSKKRRNKINDNRSHAQHYQNTINTSVGTGCNSVIIQGQSFPKKIPFIIQAQSDGAGASRMVMTNPNFSNFLFCLKHTYDRLIKLIIF